MAHESEFVVVFAGSGIDAALMRSLLESAGIVARLDGEYVATIAPHLAAAGVKVIVRNEDSERAREIVADHSLGKGCREPNRSTGS